MKIQANDLELAVHTEGIGQPILFCNGLGSTQPHWQMVIDQLKGHYAVTTFDYRGHGLSSPAEDYSFGAFLHDLEVVIAYVSKTYSEQRPIIVAWSLSADLAVHYAAAHPDEVAKLILIDGAIPVKERFIRNEQDRQELRKNLLSPEYLQAVHDSIGTPYANHLATSDLEALNIELDEQREDLLALYGKVTCPIYMIVAQETAGSEGILATRINGAWLNGVNRLKAACPDVTVTWLEGSHQLIHTKPKAIASLIDSYAT